MVSDSDFDPPTSVMDPSRFLFVVTVVTVVVVDVNGTPIKAMIEFMIIVVVKAVADNKAIDVVFVWHVHLLNSTLVIDESKKRAFNFHTT